MRDDTRVAGHGSCNGRGAVVSCGGISAPFWVRFRVRGTGFLSRLKVKKVAGWNFAAMHSRWHGDDGITCVMDWAWLPHLRGLLHQIGET